MSVRENRQPGLVPPQSSTQVVKDLFVITACLLSAAAVMPAQGIGGFDLMSSADQAFAFDYKSTGNLDHIVLYRPGTGTIFIEEKQSGSYVPVFTSSSGVGGYDLRQAADRVMAFDYDGTGHADHLLCYRPGSGSVWVLANQSGVFTPVFTSTSGIGGLALTSAADRLIAFDYEGTGRYNYLVAYTPGTGTAHIIKNTAGIFTDVVSSTQGLGGYDLMSPNDQLIAFDYYGIGTADHLVAYRPGSGFAFILENVNGSGTFQAVAMSAMGVGSYDLLSPADRLVAYDYTGTGNQDHLLAYRPGAGSTYIIQSAYFTFSPAFTSSAGIGPYDLKSSADQIFTLDANSTGIMSNLALYRPGAGSFFVESNTAGSFMARQSEDTLQ